MSQTDFKIAAAQVASVRGDVVGNIAVHMTAIETAALHGVSVLIFPELSLTGYEPDLAAELATTATDDRWIALRNLARQHRMEVVVGVPLQNGMAKPHLGAIDFSADGTTRTYAKMHLGTSERAYFTPGNKPLTLTVQGQMIGLAICADASQPSHPRAYAQAGSTIYAAGVFLNDEWYTTDYPRLAGYATECQMLVVMANHADSVGTYRSVGRSAIWSPGGELVAQAEGTESCIVIATYSHGTWHGEVVSIRGVRIR